MKTTLKHIVAACLIYSSPFVWAGEAADIETINAAPVMSEMTDSDLGQVNAQGLSHVVDNIRHTVHVVTRAAVITSYSMGAGISCGIGVFKNTACNIPPAPSNRVFVQSAFNGARSYYNRRH